MKILLKTGSRKVIAYAAVLSGLALPSVSPRAGAEELKHQGNKSGTEGQKSEACIWLLGHLRQPSEPKGEPLCCGDPGRSMCSVIDLLHLRAWIISAKPLPYKWGN